MQKKRRGLGKLLGKKLFLLVNVVFVGLVIWGFAGEFYRSRDLQNEIKFLQAAADELKDSNKEIVSLRERFAGSGELEREARLKLNLQKPGEEVVVIQGDLSLPPADMLPRILQEAQAEPEPTNAESWWRFFFRETFNETQ